jgi:LytS/YehU family sensor histidine kinase
VVAAAAYAGWSMAAGQLCAAIMRLLESGTWTFSWTSPYLAWKALTSLLIFASLAAIRIAGVRAREARAAAARAERAETLRAEARLAVLRAQLNPHFILNVLHSLVGLTERDPAFTATALERLGTTLRYALRVQSAAVDTVPLRDELEFTRDYLELERLRLGDRLETRITVPEALLDRTVPSFTLQPLVENSIRHAIAPRSRGGIVSVTVEEVEGTLSLAVEDDGTDAPTPTPLWREEAGVGLRLLRDRLDALYDGGAALELGRSALGGFRAVIRIAPVAPDRGDGEAE